MWRRWWFLIIASMLVAGVGFAFARSRLARLKAVGESERRFRTLAETASDAIITIDEQGRIVYVNPAAEKIFGHPPQKMINAELTMLMPEFFGTCIKRGSPAISKRAHAIYPGKPSSCPGCIRTAARYRSSCRLLSS